MHDKSLAAAGTFGDVSSGRGATNSSTALCLHSQQPSRLFFVSWAVRLIEQNTTSTENGHKSIPLTQPASTTAGNVKTGVPLICPLSDMGQDKDNVETAPCYLYRQSSHFDPLHFRAENHSLHIGILATVLDL
jgi:hypothetical protein